MWSAKTDLENNSSEVSWVNQETRIEGQAFSGKFFSRTDSIHHFGIGYKGKFPEQCVHKNLEIVFDLQVRITGGDPKASVVISVQHGDSEVYWENYPLKAPVNSNSGSWFPSHNELKIPRNFSSPENIIAIYVWNESASSQVDVDDVSLDFIEKQLPVFLPENYPPINGDKNLSWNRIYSGNYFNADYDSGSGSIKILTSEGKILLNEFFYYLKGDFVSQKKSKSINKYNSDFNFLGDSVSTDATFLKFETRDTTAISRFVFCFSTLRPSLEISFVTRFQQQCTVARSALIFDFVPDLKEVYLPSTLSDTAWFQHEYWLNHCGFLAGDGENTLLIPSAKHASSLQLDTDHKRCIVNMDYYADHPFFHFPLLKKGTNVKSDISRSLFQAGDSLKSEITIYTNWNQNVFPRLMKNENGKTAALIWTEHADYTSLQTQRAIYFGCDTILHAQNAMGGFVKNKIPVTKSVFYANPDKVMNSDRVAGEKSEIATVQGTPGFREFLVELNHDGNEICLHTPDHYTTNRKLLNDALQDFSQTFHSPTWIDHGYDNPQKSNREDLMCDGLDRHSDYYAKDLWQKYGIRYLWNSYYEDSGLYAPYSYFSFMSVPYSGWGNCFPLPDFWMHPTRSDSLIHWATMNTLDPPGTDLWDFTFSESRLKDFVQSRATYCIHAYPARIDSSNGYFETVGSKIRIAPEFEKVLMRQAKFRDEGLLNLTTIDRFITHQLDLEKVECVPINGNKVRVINRSGKQLWGISFSIKARNVNVEGKELRMKQDGSDLVFWFDLSKDEEVIISW